MFGCSSFDSNELLEKLEEESEGGSAMGMRCVHDL
jgi:hypothetical protein